MPAPPLLERSATPSRREGEGGKEVVESKEIREDWWEVDGNCIS